MTASFLTAGLERSPGRQAAQAWQALARMALAVAALVAAAPLCAGVVFREVELVEGVGAASSWQQRQVFAQGEDLKILIEQSNDPLEPAGSYFLSTPDGSFFIDPARATLAPVVPADMQPTDRSRGDPVSGGSVTAVVLDLDRREPGARMLDLPTTHYIYRLRYEETVSGAGPAARVEERHEFWATAVPGADAGLQAWRERRINEDAGTGAGRASLRDAVVQMYEMGFFLRHVIERREPATSGTTVPAPLERVVRAVTQLSREDVKAESFRKPTGLADTEFLAPAPDDPPDAAERGDAAGVSGEAQVPAGSEPSTGE